MNEMGQEAGTKLISLDTYHNIAFKHMQHHILGPSR
jgi:hypothetical protein